MSLESHEMPLLRVIDREGAEHAIEAAAGLLHHVCIKL